MATKRVYNPPKAIKRGYAPQMATKRVYAPKRIRPWLMAARPKTLAGAVAPVLVGVACAGVFKPLPVALCLLFAVMMQVTANFVNDLVDYRRGNDDEGRLGPVRACQAGLIRPEAMQRGIVVSTVLSCLVGLPLVLWGGWPMLLVGVACVLFCFLYSTLLAGRGGGDVLVVVFFGLVPVCVTAYVLTGVLADWRTVCLALAMGLATDTLLIVNNYRDLLQDRAHGKRTLCVWLGKRGSERLHLAMGGVATFVACLALAPKKWIILTPYIIMHISNNRQLRRYGQTTMQNLVLGRTAMAILLFALLTVAVSAWAQTYPISPVPFTSVSVTPQTFWGQRLQASREVTIPLAFSKCESEGRYRNFEIAARQLKGEDTSDVKVKGYSFDDTDVFKTIEGASYILQTYPDRQLEAYIDSVLAIVATAQEPDGYLYTARTMNPAHPHDWAGKERWVKVEDLSHEFYNLGHMVEGAIAHYQATGKRTFLDIAMRYADCVCRSIGEGEGQSIYVPGHQIAEMALAKLYVVTGERKYLDQAKFFLDWRGKTSRTGEYSQAHKPVVEQDEAVGHAVRAAYMYSGMADVAALTGDEAYITAIDRIWDNIVSKKMYVTGGIGSTSSGEAFGKNYELPNMSAYCETCAAIGNVYLNHRLFLLHGESKYYDVLERSLYNGVISGVALDGGKFFYPNPLESMGQHQRQAWFGCACCPSNICRFIPSVPGYFYQTKGRDLYVNLFGSNTANVAVEGKRVSLSQETNYPWDGDITIRIDENRAGQLRVRIRIPGWVTGQTVPSDLYSYADNKQLAYTVKVNGTPVTAELEEGYFGISRKWKKGDRIEVHFDMEPRLVTALERVSADQGRTAIERGPIVYCAEQPDNDFDLGGMLLNQKPQFQVQETTLRTAEGEYPIVGLTTDAQLLHFGDDGALTTEPHRLTLIPYYAWNHRGPSRMMVWLPQQLRATSPAQPASLASRSQVTSSTQVSALSAINDRLIPKNADDRSIPYCHWWPKQGTTEWLQYDLPEETEVSTCAVYWFDDAPWGGCRVPQTWRVLHKTPTGNWQPVIARDAYTTLRGERNAVHFQPVKTTALRLEVTLPEDNSAGLYEWEVE